LSGDNKYIVNSNDYDKETGDFIISLQEISLEDSSSDEPARTEYNIVVNEKTANISPIANIVDHNIKYDATAIMFMYVIAYDTASFEFWSSTLGYTQEYIVFSQKPLT